MTGLKQLVLEETKLRGMEEGYLRAQEDIALRLLSELHLTDEQIIKFTDVTPKLVTRLRKKVQHVN